MSGWVERIFWTMAVASASGGVQISSTTISIPLALSSFSRSGLKKKTVAAVLSPTIAAFLSGCWLRFARSTTRSSACSACTEETGLVERVLEAALRDRVGVGEREPRHLEPLGHLGDAEGEGAEPRADPRADLLARQRALGRAHRLLHAV